MVDRGRLQSADRLLGPAVAETLSNLELSGEDLALSRLAGVYAAQIDHAAGAAAQADRVLRAAIEDGADQELVDLVQALKAKLAERTAVAELGPKLQAALTELGATPKYRAQRTKGGAPSGPGRLAQLRANRAS
ncbi:hypothetical protein ABZ215_24650 [Amycolatopsis sp. NPDC006131]|uniref:terminase small subunit n=1 Tax=Amycolatopsis sp. NPDC006131 TaxID=3156731 RepID=UPI0033B0A665